MTINIKKTLGVIVILAVLVLSFLTFGSTVRAQTNTSSLEQIQALIKMIEQLQSQITQLQGGSTGSQTVGQCVELTRALYLGLSDSVTAGEVSKLQQFLGITPTGYFGPLTEQALQRWQAANNIVSSGEANTTGFGVTGPSTRSALAQGCASISSAAVTPIPTGTGAASLPTPVINSGVSNNSAVPAAATAATPSCSLTTNKSSYQLGEPITVSWTSRNATYTVFEEDTSGKDGLLIPSGEKMEASGSYTTAANVSGEPYFLMSVYNNVTRSSCEVTIAVN